MKGLRRAVETKRFHLSRRVLGSIASWVRASCLGFALLGVSSGAAQAQVITEFSTGITASASPFGITAGPDGNLWFAEFGGSRIGRITPLGVVTEFSTGITAGAFPFGITAGPDGNLWFTENTGTRIGRITTLGVVTEFSTGLTVGAQPRGITAGPDGNLWFAEAFDRIGRITTGAVITPTPAQTSTPTPTATPTPTPTRTNTPAGVPTSTPTVTQGAPVAAVPALSSGMLLLLGVTLVLVSLLLIRRSG